MASEDAASSFDDESIDGDLEDLTAMLSIDENDTDLIAAIEAASPTSSPKATVELNQNDSGEQQQLEDNGGQDDHLMSSLMEAISDENFDLSESNRVDDNDGVDDHHENEHTIDFVPNGNEDEKEPSNTESSSSPGGPQTDNSTTQVEPTKEGDDTTKKGEGEESDQQKVPLQQFMNAMTIIQDLEARVAALENERALLLEQNEQQQSN